MKLMVAGLGLMLLACSAFPQSTPSVKPPEKSGTGRNVVKTLQDDASMLPDMYMQLAERVKFSNWDGCPADQQSIDRDMLYNFQQSVNNVRFTADTIRVQKRPSLQEAAEASHIFGIGVAVTLVISRATALCTDQLELSKDFLEMSERFMNASDNAYQLELALIEAEEDVLQELWQNQHGKGSDVGVKPKNQP